MGNTAIMSYILKAVTAPAVNNAGGTGTFAVDDLTRLRRFLILGCEGGTYYTGEKEMTIDNAGVISQLITYGRGTEVVAEVVAISTTGRSAKQSQGLFALAMAARLGDSDDPEGGIRCRFIGLSDPDLALSVHRLL